MKTGSYIETRSLTESSINLTASAFLSGFRTYSNSATAALCISDSANTMQSEIMFSARMREGSKMHKLIEVYYC